MERSAAVEVGKPKRNRYRNNWYRKKRKPSVVVQNRGELTIELGIILDESAVHNLESAIVNEQELPFDCDICSESMSDRFNAVVMSCHHEFCCDCAVKYVRAGIAKNYGQHLRFNNLFCPFRCGSCFDSAISIPTSLADIVAKQLRLFHRAEKVALNQLAKDGLLTEELQNTCRDINRYALNTYSIYVCRDCHLPFPMRQQCQAGEAEEEGPGYWCRKCTKLGQANMKISVYQPEKRMSIGEDETNTMSIVVDSDDNAMAQQLEVQVLQSMYPLELTVLLPAPTAKGDRTASFTLRCPNPNAYDDRDRVRVASQIALQFDLPSDYPAACKPTYKILTGDLSLAECDSFLRLSLTEHLDLLLSQKIAGDPCVYDVFMAYLEWLYLGLDKPIAHRNAQKHRLIIAEDILTMRCPRRHCGAAILDFTGCFALYCTQCGCGFCGWCMEDCGEDAHAHVRNCGYNSNPGDYFAPYSEFERVHKVRRRDEILHYLWTEVSVKEREIVTQCIKHDVLDVGIDFQYIQKHLTR